MFDEFLVEKIRVAHNSKAGKLFTKIVNKLGGAKRLLILNMLCTTALGFFIAYPVFLAGGLIPAIPFISLTSLVDAMLFFVLLNRWLGHFVDDHILRKILLFAIVFSLPFGLLSLPLLRDISIKP